MRVFTLISLVAAAMVAAFVALNWSAITESTRLSLGVAPVQAPLGLVLLGVLAVVTAAFVIHSFYLRHTARKAAAENARKLEAQRELAERVETSRYTQLREYLDESVRRRCEREELLRAELDSRLDRIEAEIRGIRTERETGSVDLGPLADHGGT